MESLHIESPLEFLKQSSDKRPERRCSLISPSPYEVDLAYLYFYICENMKKSTAISTLEAMAAERRRNISRGFEDDNAKANP
jgi:hypothetical protein